MKKLVSLMLALVLTVTCAAAFALTPVPEGSFNMDIDTFKSLFSQAADTSGTAFVWTGDAAEDANGVTLTLDKTDEAVTSITVSAAFSANLDDESTFSIGNSLGVAISGAVLLSAIFEGTDVQEATEALQSDITVISDLFSSFGSFSDQEFIDGIDRQCTLCGYPCLIKLLGQVEENDAIVYISLILLPQGSTIE